MKVETKTLYKCFTDVEKEEEWINQTCKEGWKIIKIVMGFAYTFEKCEINEYIIRCYCFDEKGQKKQESISRILEQGAEIIPYVFNEIPQIVYFIRKSNLGEFEIDKDIDSKIAQYRKRQKMYKYLGLMFIFLGITFLNLSIIFSTSSISSKYVFGACAIVELIGGIIIYLPVLKYNKIIKALEEEKKDEKYLK